LKAKVYIEKHECEMTNIHNVFQVLGENVVSISFLGFLLVKCDDHSSISSLKTPNTMMNYFFSFWMSLVKFYYIKYKFLDVYFHEIKKLSNLYYFKYLHFWSLVGSSNRKMKTCYVKLTNYMLITHLKMMWYFFNWFSF